MHYSRCMSQRASESLRAVLARNLKVARGKKGWSQARLAEAVSVSSAFVGEIEVGRKSPSLETLEAFANALDVAPFELLQDASHPTLSTHRMMDDLSQDLVHVIRERLQTYLETPVDKKDR